MFKTVLNQNTRDLIIEFVKTDFTLKYNNSVLGFLWVLIKPLVLFIVLFVITSKVFPNDNVRYYPLYLLLGTIMLSYWSEATMSGMNSLLVKSNLILKVNFPRYIAIVSSVLLPVINFFINIVVFLVIEVIFFQKFPDFFGFLLFLFSVITLFILILGFSLLTSIIFVRLRDLGSIWELVTNLIFWVTPIVYTIDTIKNKSQGIGNAIEYFNPISVALQAARKGFIPESKFDPKGIIIWFFISVIICTIGYFYFRKEVNKIAESF